MYRSLAKSPSTFADMTTYYCHTLEEALRLAKNAGKSLDVTSAGSLYGLAGEVLQSIGKGR